MQGREKAPLRGDIQALRAFAVGVVLLNHFWPERLTGGFIGVDIFFVISGYLITAHLHREITLTGHIQLVSFWARRAKRLLPVAMIVLFFSILVAALWLPITERQSSFDQIGAAGAYWLNWLLAASSVDYFAQGAALSPVTHYWSLSVEEQFYILWPILLLLGAIATKRVFGRSRNSILIMTIAIVSAASFAWAAYSASTAPAAAYFETTGRAWEFAIGGLIAFIPAISTKLRAAAIPALWLAWGALFLAAYTYDPSSGVPGPKALLPVLATAAIIIAGDINHPWAPRALTSFAPVQAMGNLSYSLYLWHWPLIVAAPFVLNREITARDKFIIIALTFALALLSKRFVEDPIRNSRATILRRPQPVLLLSAASLAALLAISVPMSINIGIQARASAQALYEQAVDPSDCFGAQAALSGTECENSHVLRDPYAVLGTWGVQNEVLANGNSCQQVRGNPEVISCSFGKPEGEQRLNVALVGDSHAGMWVTALDAIAQERGIRVTTYLDAACPVTSDSSVVGAYDSIPYHQAACLEWRENVIASIAESENIDVVITSSRDRSYNTVDGVPDSGDGYVTAWNSWLGSGKQVIVLNDVPNLPFAVPECLASAKISGDCTAPADAYDRLGPLGVAAEKISDPLFSFVDYVPVFCDSRCYSVIGGIPAYLDGEHLSAAFARSFGPKFLDNIELIDP